MRPRRRVADFKLKVGDSIIWPDGAIVVTEVVSEQLYRTRCLVTLQRDWLQQQDWLDGDYTVVRSSLKRRKGGRAD